jgi:hypothetical protein
VKFCLFSPPAVLTVAAKAMFDRESYVHWPARLFDEEIRQQRLASDSGPQWRWKVMRRTSTYEILPSDKVAHGAELAVEDGTEADEEEERPLPGDDEAMIAELHQRTVNRDSEGDVDFSLDDAPPPIPTVEEVAIAEARVDSDEESDDGKEEATATAVAVTAVPTVRGVPVPPAIPKKKKKRKPTLWEQASKRVIKVGGTIVDAAEKLIIGGPDDSDRTHGVGWQKDAWWIGRRGRCLIGIACTEKSSTVSSKKIVTSVQLTKDSKSTRCEVFLCFKICVEFPNDRLVQRRVCGYRHHAWIVKVGTLVSSDRSESRRDCFESLQDFASFCLSIKWTAGFAANGTTYVVDVNETGNTGLRSTSSVHIEVDGSS